MFYNVFISKRIKAESFDAKKRQKMAQAMTDFQKQHPEQQGTGVKRHGDTIEYLFRRGRKSAKPRILSGR